MNFARTLLIASIVPAAMAASAANQTTREVKRSAKKMGHRMEESVCAKGDAACLEQKAKHRAEEAKDYMKDKAKDAKDKAHDKMDSD